ncbi:MAG: hypothetical protein RMJ17_00455 [Candidatus Aenigmarchaeota archaeon]|nr:hypothetical protein [Candidatus Aenigmarchaeota archaeon]MDW8149060.1 hypothetical protein [Candidatus Aenigmarchaeota archaeon]
MKIDIIVAVGIFVVTIVFLIFLVFSYISRQITSKELEDIKIKAIDVFKSFVSGEFSVEKNIYRIPILLKEPNFDNRSNEAIELLLNLDFDCSLNITNSSIFITDENFKEIEFNKTIIEKCFDEYVKMVELIFNVDISKNKEKMFFVYFYDEKVVDRSFSIYINTDSFAPKDGDKYTENSNNWERVGGTVSQPSITEIKKIGTYAIKIEDHPSSRIGLLFNFPTDFNTRYNDNLISVNTGWYLRVFLYINKTSDIVFNISLEDASGNRIFKSANLKTGWNLFEEELNNSNWYNWSYFNPRNITKFYFVAENKTISDAIFLAVDGLRLEKKPLIKTIYPVEKIRVVSKELLEKIKNEDIELLKKIYGDRFYIEISP